MAQSPMVWRRPTWSSTYTVSAFALAAAILAGAGALAAQEAASTYGLGVALARPETAWMTGNTIRVDGGEDFVGSRPPAPS